MFRSVVWQLVHGQSGGMPWIRIANNNIIWCYYISWASPLLIFFHAIFSTKDRRPFLRSEEMGLKHPRVGRPFRARRLMTLHPGLKHLGYSVRPLRGHRKCPNSSDGRGRPSYIETRTSTSATRNPRNFQGLFPFSSALLSRMDRRGPFVARARPGRSTTSIQP
jgi:hypothetical protein